MKQLGYGKQYKYAHDYDGHFVRQQYLPDELQGRRFWHAQSNAAENQMAQRQHQRWDEAGPQ